MYMNCKEYFIITTTITSVNAITTAIIAFSTATTFMVTQVNM